MLIRKQFRPCFFELPIYILCNPHKIQKLKLAILRRQPLKARMPLKNKLATLPLLKRASQRSQLVPQKSWQLLSPNPLKRLKRLLQSPLNSHNLSSKIVAIINLPLLILMRELLPLVPLPHQTRVPSVAFSSRQ